MEDSDEDDSLDPFGSGPLPWPEQGQDLRRVGPTRTSHGLLGWQRGSVWSRIIGYQRAAEILAADLTEVRADLDHVIFPFAGCWHAELELKLLLGDLERLHGRPRRSRRHHNILQLWQETRALLLELDPPIDRQDLANAERILRQLSELDPDRQDFRYHARRDGTLSLSDVDRLDIAAFHEAMTGVAAFLGGVHEQVASELVKLEGLADY